jgi:hypothetical protein
MQGPGMHGALGRGEKQVLLIVELAVSMAVVS